MICSKILPACSRRVNGHKVVRKMPYLFGFSSRGELIQGYDKRLSRQRNTLLETASGTQAGPSFKGTPNQSPMLLSPRQPQQLVFHDLTLGDAKRELPVTTFFPIHRSPHSAIFLLSAAHGFPASSRSENGYPQLHSFSNPFIAQLQMLSGDLRPVVIHSPPSTILLFYFKLRIRFTLHFPTVVTN